MRKVENFRCRVCGGTEYIEVTADEVFLGFECCTCSAMFGNPHKFTKPSVVPLNHEQPNTEIKTPVPGVQGTTQ